MTRGETISFNPTASKSRKEFSPDPSAYLLDKSHLYQDFFSVHFKSIPGLYSILSQYMEARATSRHPRKLSLECKKELVSKGVYNDPELLEFLLLIAERERQFDKPSSKQSDVVIAHYYFDQYKGQNERWHKGTYRFFEQHTSTYKRDRFLHLEELAIRLIAKSRGYVAEAIDPKPPVASQLLKSTNTYFQKAYRKLFGRVAPANLSQRTFITLGIDSFADRISGKSFIAVSELSSSPIFRRLAVHEALHLCFEGFEQKIVEEAYIEHIISTMIQKLSPPFVIPQYDSKVYDEFRTSLSYVFAGVPGLENQFNNYFLTGDFVRLERYIKSKLTVNKRNELQTRNLRYLDLLLNALISLSC